MQWLIRGLLSLFVLAGTALVVIDQWRPGMEQYRARHHPDLPIAPGALTAQWFGVTAVLLGDGSHAVMADPFFTRPPGLINTLLNREIAPDEAAIRRWLARAGVTRLDAVVVSHSHYDHAMDAGAVARITGAVLVGSESTLNIGRGAGLPESQLRLVQPGRDEVFGSFTLRFTESPHSGDTYSIHVAHPQGAVLLHGSSAAPSGGLPRAPAEVAFLSVAAIDDLDAYLRDTVEAVGAKRVIPTHWDDFWQPLEAPLKPLPLSRLDRFFAAMDARPQFTVLTLEPGQRVPLFPPPAAP